MVGYLAKDSDNVRYLEQGSVASDLAPAIVSNGPRPQKRRRV